MSKSEKEERKNWITRTKEYLTSESNAVPLKCAIFCFNAAGISVFPFIVLQMRLLRMTIKEIAVVFLLVPIASLVGPVVMGMIADKFGNFNTVNAFNMLMTVIFFDLLLIIPPIEKESISIFCFPEEGPLVNVSNRVCSECLFVAEEPKNITVTNCKTTVNSSILKGAGSENFVTHLLNETSSVLTLTDTRGLERNCSLDLLNVYFGNETFSNITGCDYDIEISCELESVSNCTTPMSQGESTTIGMFFTFLFLGHFFAAAAFTMLDASLLAASKKHNLEVGKQKIWGLVAFGLTPLLAGALIDAHSRRTGEQSYLMSYMLATIFGLAGCVIMIFTSITVAKNENNMLKDLGILIRRLEVDLFWIVCFVLGCHFGFIEGYLFIYLKSLNAPNYLLGLTLTVGFFSSVPVVYYADWIEKKIGRLSIFLVCFTCYFIRFFGYSFMKNAWVSLIFETLEAFTYQLMWITCLKLCPILAPKGLLATTTGVAGAMHYSVGRGVGAFLGGILIAHLGIQMAYRVFGCIALVCGGLYWIAHACYFKKIFAFREKELKDREEMEKLNADNMATQTPTSKDHEIEINKSLMVYTSSLTNIPPSGKTIAKRRPKDLSERECVSFYENLTDDHKYVLVNQSDSPTTSYPFDHLKNISKSEGNLINGN